MDGGKSPTWMHNGNAASPTVLGADSMTPPGQTPMVKPRAWGLAS